MSADVGFNGTNFVLSAFLAGSPLTNGATYVWGANRGAGTARFAANDPGLGGVLFDSVIALTYDSTANTWGGVVNLLNGVVTPLAPGSVLVESTNITVLLPGNLLPSTGFAPGQYGFNLWPRGAGIAGFAGISDFAPNNATIAPAAVPEPAAWGMMILGFGITGFAARRRRRSVPVLA